MRKALQATDCNKVTGEDKQKPTFLKLCALLIANIIKFLFNLSISTDVRFANMHM